MNSIRKTSEFTLRERGSKFYGFLFPCPSSEIFEERLSELKKKYPDATHHCTAYRVLELELREFSNDDGEPSGSAGLPILNSLRSSDLINCGAIVVRYYGGTKLGKSGLIEAYSEGIKGCIEKAEIAQIQKMTRIKVTYSYQNEKEIQQIIRNHELVEESSSFTESVSKILLCLESQFDLLKHSLEKIEYLGIEFKSLGHTFVMI